MSKKKEAADAEVDTRNTGDQAPAERTTKSKRQKKGVETKNTPVLFEIESEKDEIGEVQAAAVRETLPGYEEQLREDQANLEDLRVRLVSRQGAGIERDDADGEDIYLFDENRRNGRRKMPNNKSTYKLIASCKGLGIDEKQIRRLADRWRLILLFRKMGVIEPRLGVSHYDAVRSLGSVDEKLEALRDAEQNGLSVTALRDKYIHESQTETLPPNWKELLRDEASKASGTLTAIHKLMEEQGGIPDQEVLGWIDDIIVAANSFIPAAKEAA